MAEIEKNIGESRMSEEPRKPMKFMLSEGCVKEKHLADNAVTTRVIKDKNVTPEKLSNSVQGAIVTPITNQLDSKYSNITNLLDKKFTNKTNELYSMIVSTEAGGVALSQAFGYNTDIGISQKTLTKAFGRFWDEMSTITGKTYMDFKLTIVPDTAYTETGVEVTITADCTGSISNFDSIKIYIDDVLVAESSDIEVFVTSQEITHTCIVKAVGVILGKTITKTQQVVKEIPFLMGSGMTYQEVMVPENLKQLIGTLEGDYDVVVKNTGEYIFLIIPLSHKDEFRRAVFDMNGFEIPLTTTETTEYIICQTINRYQAGTYNIDINING